MNYLLDTNVLSELRRPVPDSGVVSWLDTVDEDRTYLSVISVAEIARGTALLEPGKRRDALAHWLEHDLMLRFGERLLGIDPPASLIWGRLMAETRLAGIGLSVMDGWIAALAISHDLVVVTRNSKDFERLPLQLLNPWRES